MINRIPFEWIANRKNLIGVEIGVDQAFNALNILENLDIKKLYLIDPYYSYGGFNGKGVLDPARDDEDLENLYQEALDRLSKHTYKLVWLKELSETAVDKVEDNLDFIYLDGNHRYEYVLKDLELYYPKVKSGGLVAGDDFQLEGVQKALRAFEPIHETRISHNRDAKQLSWGLIKK